MRWWVLAFLSAVVLLASAFGFVWQQHATPVSTGPVPSVRHRCPDVDAPVPALVIPPQTTPVLLSAGRMQLYVDKQPTSSPPGEPKRFATGEHTLGAVAEGTAFEMTFRLEPFHPAMFHFEETAGVGITVVYLGAGCVSCSLPGTLSLDFTRTSASDDALLEQAAKSLRTGDWRAAAARLRGVQPKQRAKVAFRRLAANVYQSAGQPELARAELKKIAAPELAEVLRAFEPLSKAEQGRHGSAGMLRWNRLTQKFSTLLEKVGQAAPGPVQLATSRLAELTAGFLDATQQNDALAQVKTVVAAEEALELFVRALRRSRPDDCEFQALISASLRGEDPALQ